jgi:hypothetical protein
MDVHVQRVVPRQGIEVLRPFGNSTQDAVLDVRNTEI